MIALPVRGGDAEVRFTRALLRSAAAAGLSAAVESARARPWSSATYVGTQLTLTLAAPRAGTLGRWLADLPLAELPMRGHLVASIALDRIEDDGATVRATLTALLVEEA